MAAPSGLGINYDFDGSNSAGTQKDLDYLWSLGIRKLRLNIPIYQTEPFNPSFRDNLTSVAQKWKNMGGHTIGGYNGFPLNSGNIAAFKSAMRTYATRVVGIIDEICVGNEEDLNTGFSQADLQTNLKDVCQTIKVTDGFPGTVHTPITTNVYTNWQADYANWKTYMKLDLHIYGILGDPHFDTYAKAGTTDLGTDVFCSEFGVDSGRLAFTTDRDWIREIKRRADLLASNNWSSFYYFNYSTGSNDAEETRWAAFRTSSTGETPLPRVLTKSRPIIVSTD